jgi:hypothetical protein
LSEKKFLKTCGQFASFWSAFRAKAFCPIVVGVVAVVVIIVVVVDVDKVRSQIKTAKSNMPSLNK